MEINITEFYNTANPKNYSASIAEIGEHAGKITWNNAVQTAAYRAHTLLDTAEKLEAMRKWARASGGWDDTEIAAFSDNELNALFIQLVSGDIREKDDTSWADYAALAERGHCSGNLFEGIDGEIYYSLE